MVAQHKMIIRKGRVGPVKNRQAAKLVSPHCMEVGRHLAQ